MRILVIITLLLFSCSNSKKAGDQNSSQTTVENGLEVKILLTTTGAYCGGVEPSQEQLEEIRTPKPYANKKVYLRKGNENDVSKPVDFVLESDSLGVIKTHLPEGTYSIVFEDKSTQEKKDQLIKKYGEKTDQRSAIDQECLDKHFLKPEAVLKVQAGQKNEVTVNKQVQCPWGSVPCSRYTGPLPP